MLSLIIKDSVILFLLVYAMLELAEACLKLIKKSLFRPTVWAKNFHVIDLSGFPVDRLEGCVRQSVHSSTDPVFLITENNTPETEVILSKLKQEFSAFYPVSRGEFQQITSSRGALDAFLKTGLKEDLNPDK